MSIKPIAVRLLQPIAWLWRRLAPLGRLWHHARLRERLANCEHGPGHGGQTLDPSVVVLGMPEVHGSANIQLGRALYLYPGLYLETQGAGRIEIGDEVVMSRGVHLVAFDQIRIGAGSMIGEYSSIRDANHRTDDQRAGGSENVTSETATGQALRWAGHRSAPITIGRQVWIGRGVTVLAGVRIGDGAVIGANAVVTRDIPAGAVAVGVPARVLPGGRAPTAVSGDADAAIPTPPPA